MNLTLSATGPIGVETTVEGIGTVVEQFYPLCGNAVQTNVETDDSAIRVRPDTYTQRTVVPNQ